VRHRNLRTKVRGNSAHNHAMYANMLLGLVEHGRIETTQFRARVLRSMAEKMVTRATRLGELLLKDPSKLEAADKARLMHAKRVSRRVLRQESAVVRLYEEIAPRYLGRPGGYTRTYKLGFRKGDGASVCILEFVQAEMPEREGKKTEAPAAPEKKGRLASLLGGKKKAEKGEKAEKPAKKSKKDKDE